MHRGVLLVLAVLTFLPFVFLFVTSFKSIPQFYRHFWRPVLPLHFKNYLEAWNEIGNYISNSIIVSGMTLIAVLALASVSGFVFARYSFPGRKLLFAAIVSLLLIPGSLTLVPTFMLVNGLGWLNKYRVLIVPFVSGGQVVAIFLMRNYFASIPEDLFESARIDGASGPRLYLHVGLPLAKPMLGVVCIVNLLGTWNNFIWPFVTVTDENRSVVTNGLMMFHTAYGTRIGPMFAGYLIASLPLVILFLMMTRAFMRGITSGAIKV